MSRPRSILAAFAIVAAIAGQALAAPPEAHPFRLVDAERGWLVSPGFYHDFDDVIGAELSLIRGLFGLAIGIEGRGAGYLEAEMLIGPVSFGFGPRYQDGRIAPQMTFALPLFFVFPYWRWRNQENADGHSDSRLKEFGIMLKVPFGSKGKVVPTEPSEVI